MLQHALKNFLRSIGVDVRRTKSIPSLTFLGLRAVPLKTVLDVGANVGQFASYAHELFPHATLHCFEPLPNAAERLRGLARSLGKEKIHVHEVALGERAGSAELFEHLDHSPSSSFLRNTARQDAMYPQTTRQAPRTVGVKRLDDWVRDAGVTTDELTLLKLDVQGFEGAVLRGASQTLRQIGMCLIEVTPAPLYEQQTTFAEVVALLAAAGLHYLGNLEQFTDRAGMPIYMDALFVRADVYLKAVKST